MDVKEMTFEEFIAFGEKKTGQKVNGQLKKYYRLYLIILKVVLGQKRICAE